MFDLNFLDYVLPEIGTIEFIWQSYHKN